MLSRHKKKGYEGFKYFVGFLETLSTKKKKDIIESAILEDPVYMMWVLKNMININYLLTMDTKSIETFFTKCPNVLEVVAKSIISHPLKEKIRTEFVPQVLRKELDDLINIFKEIPKSAQEAAIFFVLGRIRSLQEKVLIEEFNWKLPGRDVAYEPVNKMQNGEYILKYENGETALEGTIELTRREGLWNHFYNNGTLMAKGNYKRDLKYGQWTFYGTSGQVKAEGKFDDDRKHGKWTELDSHGNNTEVSYEKGKVITD